MEYFTNSQGIAGRLRQRISDFAVEEIPPKNLSHAQLEQKLKEKKFSSSYKHTIFWMEKFNWDTHQALHEIARKLHVSQSRFGIAGTKDKRAITKQRVSAWEISTDQLEKIKIRDIKLYGFEPADKKIQLGESGGNKFEIIIRDIDLPKDEIEKRLTETFSQLQKGIPNLFGPQRFGEVRKITHLVGEEILKGDFENALKIYLAKAFEAEPDDSKDARNSLAANWGQKGFAEAAGKFPRRLKYEVALCNYLSQNPKDFIGAFKIFPKKLQKMFVNAVQAWVWNETVLELWKRKMIPDHVKIFGHETKLSKTNEADKIISHILETKRVKSENFQIKEIKDISSKGGEREFLLKPKDLKILEISEDEFNEGKLKAKISFSLPPGSYATIILAEIMKTENSESF
ncbi:MAG TPA: tRNA pseudouridine(13) synthase TruD [archaeon]|nr:tRNA pseudouridine(13) synthase TruD [archaeon]